MTTPGVVLRPIGAALLAAVLAACSASLPAGGFLTSRAGAFDMGCPANRIDGLLVADITTGTAIEFGSERTPIVWPFGYTATARARDGGLEILDPAGTVVARTGERVALSGGRITGDGRWSTCGPPLARD